MRRAVLFALTATPLLAAPALADCARDIRDALIHANQSGPYRSTITVTGDNPVQGTVEMVPPTGLHSNSVMGGQTMEMIFTDGKGWMNVGDGWTELPSETARQAVLAFDPETIETMGSIGDAQCLGLTTVEGKDLITFKYNFEISGTTSISTLYLDPATKLPARMEAKAEVAGGTSDMVSTIEYDPSITISPPAL
jgi:hypothetical protein